MGYTGNNHYAQKYDASKAYDKDLTASARLHYLENSEHDKHDHHHPAKMCGPGNHAPKMHGSMKGDQSDQHIDYKNYKGTDKGYHGSTGSSHGDQSNIFHDYDKHPAKMYGEPATKNLGFIKAETLKKDPSATTMQVGDETMPIKMAGDMGHNVLAEDIRSNQIAGASGDMGYAGDASGAVPMLKALGKPALMLKKGIASMCGMKK
mgnify:CR=1 FL=1